MVDNTQFRLEYLHICREHELFTCGDLEQYGEVKCLYSLAKSQLVQDGSTDLFFTLVYATWLCSDKDKFTIIEVDKILRPYFEKEDTQ